MDIIIEAGGEKFTIPAIYELKVDQLKLCHSDRGAAPARPKDFTPQPGIVVAILKKQKS
jgi:uncharacterized protein (TIGR03067 family)